MTDITQLVLVANKLGASDIHLIYGLPPKIRLNGILAGHPSEKTPLTAEDCCLIAKELAGKSFPALEKAGELDLAITFEGIRCRINIFRQQGYYSVALRILSEKIPKMEELGLPPAVMAFPQVKRGIILVTGETGSGKSTTLASIIGKINHTRADHIVTLEDPIEYVHNPDRCIINQREIGKDTKSFDSGLRAVLREDPDIILVGEMRDYKTIDTAITAAETGHLVLATLHTKSAAESIDRMVNVFPGDMQGQVRMELSTCLHAVLSQQLLRSTNGGRVLACELMMVNGAIRNLIREGKTPQINSSVQSSAAEGSILMDTSVEGLFREDKISREVALSAAHYPDTLREKLIAR